MTYNQHDPSKYASGSNQGSEQTSCCLAWFGWAGSMLCCGPAVKFRVSANSLWESQPVPSYRILWVREAEWLRSAAQGHKLVLNPGYLRECRRQTLLHSLSGKLLSFLILDYVDCLPVGKWTHSQAEQDTLAMGSTCNHSRIGSHSRTCNLHATISKTRAHG